MTEEKFKKPVESADKKEQSPVKEPDGSPVPADAQKVQPDRHKPKARRLRPRRREQKKESSDYIEKVVTINRVSKVVAGGKNFSFGALVVVGDGKGRVGFAVGKAREVQDAIRKGLEHAKSSMIRIPMKGATIPHAVLGRYGAAKVLLKPASEGTGVIAGATVRAVCESAGIHDILTKSLGSETALNVVRATLAGMQSMIQDTREAEGQK